MTISASLSTPQCLRPLWTNTIPVHPPPKPEPCSIPIARPPILLKPVRSPDKAVPVAGVYKFNTLPPVQHRSGPIVSFIPLRLEPRFRVDNANPRVSPSPISLIPPPTPWTPPSNGMPHGLRASRQPHLPELFPGDEESRIGRYLRPVTHQRFRAIGNLGFDDCPLCEGDF